MASSKLSQILILQPASEIVFKGPYVDTVTAHIQMRNPTPDQKVCFKVKTTAPRKYCVRPNSGIIDPGKSIKIAIMLQPVEKISELAPTKHKFMVQSMIIDNSHENIDNIWQTADQSKIMDSKLRCVFLDENSQPIGASSSSSSSTTQAAVPSQEAPAHQSAAAKTTASAAKATSTSISSSSSTPLQAQVEPDRATASSAAANVSQQSQRDRQPVVGFSSKTVTEYSDGESRTDAVSSGAGGRSPSNKSPRLSSPGAADTTQNISLASLSGVINRGEYTLVYTAFFMLIIGVLLGKFLL